MKPKYNWPSSAISEEEMALLYKARKENGKPISKLIKEAIKRCYGDKDE